MRKRIRLYPEDRIQIAPAKDADLTRLVEGLEARSIFLFFREVNSDFVDIEVQAEDGFVVECYNDMLHPTCDAFAELDRAGYGRLVEQINFFEAWRIDVDGDEEDLSHIQSQPIVIKCYERPEGKQLLFAGIRSVCFERVTPQDHYTATPDKVPDEILRVMYLVDEPIPEKYDQIESAKNRVRELIRQLYDYLGTKLTLKAREEARLCLLEAKDFVIKCLQAQQAFPQHYEERQLIHLELHAMLRQRLGSKVYDQILTEAHRKARGRLVKAEATRQALLERNSFKAFFSDINDDDVAGLMLAMYDGHLLSTVKTNKCLKCGDKPTTFRIRIHGEKARKVRGPFVFGWQCKPCNVSLTQDKCNANKLLAMLRWNQLNATGDEALDLHALFQMSGLDLKERTKRTGHLVTVLNNHRKTIKQDIAAYFDPEETQRLDMWMDNVLYLVQELQRLNKEEKEAAEAHAKAVAEKQKAQVAEC